MPQHPRTHIGIVHVDGMQIPVKVSHIGQNWVTARRTHYSDATGKCTCVTSNAWLDLDSISPIDREKHT